MNIIMPKHQSCTLSPFIHTLIQIAQDIDLITAFSTPGNTRGVDGDSIASLCFNNNSVADTAITEVAKPYQQYRGKKSEFLLHEKFWGFQKISTIMKSQTSKIPINDILSIWPAKTFVSNLSAVTFADRVQTEFCIVEQPSKPEEPF